MRCERCKGCMIRDSFVDLRDDTGRVLFEGWRCINCGEVVDPVVLTHRIEVPAKPYQGQTRDRRTWERLTAV
ncbi:MAG: hypothetical protein Nkreftii_002993 [Candidatus Nitrospira kreftii]|uniref:Uncharacterized protein n=1 Tax=Candidatus Nitrospira kreftii TaxID=2652173 RepID=A0A7S8J0L5_9BACT|nr:MAG: hypothetical protein Nkreftii_002993 [Candidatus Nitrospira kreftii]